MPNFTLHQGDCLDVLRQLPDCHFDSIACDPPYGYKFMGHKWDYDVPSVEVWREALRVLRPGGHLLAFSGARTYHRMVTAIEDGGFEIRDQLMWVFSQGFPKSKNLDGAWQGWGSALKPAHEPICLARKPLSSKTIAANVLAHGTGAINIDGCRVATADLIAETTNQNIRNAAYKSDNSGRERDTTFTQHTLGRWPANLLHDGSDAVLQAFPQAPGQQGDLTNHGKCRQSPNGIFGGMCPALDHPARVESDKSAARFFYHPKASKKDRDEGNTHSTVKPTEVCRWLLRLITPPGGTTLDMYCGSGSFGKAAMLEGFDFTGIDLDRDGDGKSLGYLDIASRRIAAAQAEAFDGEAAGDEL